MILLDSKIVIFLDDFNDVGKHGIVLRNKIEFIVEYLIMLSALAVFFDIELTGSKRSLTKGGL